MGLPDSRSQPKKRLRLTTFLQVRGSGPLLWLINLPEQLPELRKPVCSPDRQFITKDVKGYKSTA